MCAPLSLDGEVVEAGFRFSGEKSVRIPIRCLFPAVLWLTILSVPFSVHAREEIQWWHAMSGPLEEKIQALAEGFNQTQERFRVVPVYKGSDTETMTAGIAAYRTKHPPHLLQVFELGTSAMMALGGATRSVSEVMAEGGEPLDIHQWLPVMAGYYSNREGDLMALPFSHSTPVLYYNKTAFKNAGLDPGKPPKTWPQLESYARKLLASGSACGFSTSWISWIHLENLLAWHNLPFATAANGFEGLDARLTLQGDLSVHHLSQLAIWEKDHIFSYGGRRDVGRHQFVQGICPMYTDASSAHARFKEEVTFDWGVGELPYWPMFAETPQNTTVAGAGLWILSGHAPVAYQGVAQFIRYWLRPSVQADWHQSTGYLPTTLAAYQVTKESGFYQTHPDREVAVRQVMRKSPTPSSQGVRLGHMVRLRDIILHELESVIAGRKTAREGLDAVVEQGNALLTQFEKSHAAKGKK